MKTIRVCAWLALTMVAMVHGCSGEDDPPDTPADVSDQEESSDGDESAPNAPSPGLVQGDACTDDGPACETGLICVEGVCCDKACDGVCESCRGDISGGFDGTCTPLPAGDERIIEAEDYEDCPGVQTCDGNGACFARAAGEACESDSQCGSGFCTDGVCCDSRCAGTCENCATGACEAATTGTDPGTCESQCTVDGCTGLAIGDLCGSDTECGSGICDGTCVLADGNVCSANRECLNTCLNGRCGTSSAPGEPCDVGDRDDCEPGLTCASETCLIPSGNGRSCDSDDQCEEPLCVDGSCLPLFRLGEECELSSQCEDELVCRPALNDPDGPTECVEAVGNYCGNGCAQPNSRCGSIDFRDNPVCYDEQRTVQVTGWVGVNTDGVEVAVELNCLSTSGSLVQSERVALTATPGSTRSTFASTPPVTCARGSVVRLFCLVLEGQDGFAVSNSSGRGDVNSLATTGVPTGTASFVTRNQPKRGGTTELVAEQDGAAVCLYRKD